MPIVLPAVFVVTLISHLPLGMATATSCQTTTLFLNLYPSQRYRAQVAFPAHRFAALRYGGHETASFAVGTKDHCKASLINETGAVIVGSELLNVSGNFPRPMPAVCKCVVITDPSPAGHIEFLMHAQGASPSSSSMAFFLIYNAMTNKSLKVDVVVNRPGEIYSIGSCMKPGLANHGVLPPGEWQLKVFPCNVASNASDFEAMTSIVGMKTVNFERSRQYYMAVYGDCESSEYPPMFISLPLGEVTASPEPSHSTSVLAGSTEAPTKELNDKTPDPDSGVRAVSCGQRPLFAFVLLCLVLY